MLDFRRAPTGFWQYAIWPHVRSITWSSGPSDVLQRLHCSDFPRNSWIDPNGIRVTHGPHGGSVRNSGILCSFPTCNDIASVSAQMCIPRRIRLAAQSPPNFIFLTTQGFISQTSLKTEPPNGHRQTESQMSQRLSNDPSSTYAYDARPHGPCYTNRTVQTMTRIEGASARLHS